jgi:hypothetical protein
MGEPEPAKRQSLGPDGSPPSDQPGKRDELAEPPFCLELEEGIAVYPRGVVQAPRLPLLGLRAIVRNGLHLAINGKKSLVSLRS